MKSRKYIFAAGLMAMLLSGCGNGSSSADTSSSPEPSTTDTAGSDTAPADDIVIKTADAKVFNTIGKEPLEYLNTVDDKNTKNDEIAEYLYSRQDDSRFSPGSVYLSWNASDKVTYPLTLTVYDGPDMTNAVYTKVANKPTTNSTSIYNLIPGITYYYKVTDSSSPAIESKANTFTFASSLRVIYNAGDIPNMRDLGGWNTNSGGTVNYGLIYRSATWAGLSEYGTEILQDELGIKNELDVRKSYSASEYAASPFGFKDIGLTDAYPLMTTDSETITNIKKLFDYLAVEDNYPLVYHCSVGADRTGFASLLIEGALGVCDANIYHDYELTTFYYANRIRADILIDDYGNYYFREDGGRCSFWEEGGFKQVVEQNLASYYTEDGTISGAVTNFIKTKCGVSQETIDAVKDILLKK